MKNLPPNEKKLVKINDCQILTLEAIYSNQIDLSYCDLSQIDFNKMLTDHLTLKDCNLDKFPVFGERVPNLVDVSNNHIKSLKGVNKNILKLICK